MKDQHHTTTIEADAKDVVLSCIKALNNEDFKTAKSYANDDMTFDGVMGSRSGADAYFADMEKMKFKYAVKKAFADGDDVCLLTDITMSGKTLFCCSWYHLVNDKISSLKVVFDPRPLLKKSDKKINDQ